jgi:hypothetical protein
VEHLRLKHSLQALEDDKKLCVAPMALASRVVGAPAAWAWSVSSSDERDVPRHRLSKQLASAQEAARKATLQQQYGPRVPPNAAKLYEAEAVRGCCSFALLFLRLTRGCMPYTAQRGAGDGHGGAAAQADSGEGVGSRSN